MEFLEKFKAIHCYDANGNMMTQEELEPLGLAGEFYESLDESAYDSAYIISNDWAKDNPDWNDVKTAYKYGALDSAISLLEKLTCQGANINLTELMSELERARRDLRETENISHTD